MSDDPGPSKFEMRFNVQLDPSKVTFGGNFIGLNLDESGVGLFADPLEEYNSNSIVVSHTGYSDFQVNFTNYSFQHQKFKTYLIVIFSFEALDNFLSLCVNFIENHSIKLDDNGQGDKKMLDAAEKIESERKESYISNDTNYFAPNSFILFSTQSDVKIYWGRSAGLLQAENEEKKFSFYKYSVTMSNHAFLSMLEAIRTNIERFEKAKNVDFQSLLLKNRSEEK